mgnify:CR=1 FL=1
MGACVCGWVHVRVCGCVCGLARGPRSGVCGCVGAKFAAPRDDRTENNARIELFSLFFR